MKNCKNCNAEINDDVKFCQACGAAQNEEPVAQQEAFNAGEVKTDEPQNVYFAPGTEAQSATFNSGADVQNISASKKKGGKAIVPVVIGIIVAVVVAFVVKGALTAVFSDKENNDSPDSSVSDSAEDKSNSKIDIGSGTVDENGYSNSGVDLKISCPEDWKIVSGNELSELTGVPVNADGQVTTDGAYFDCMFVNEETGSNIIVSYEGNVAYAILSDDDFMEQVINTTVSSNVTATAGEPYKLQIGGATYNCVDITSTQNGREMVQTMCFVKSGKNSFEVLFTIPVGFDDADAQELISEYFTAYN